MGSHTTWGATEAESRLDFPCDQHISQPYDSHHRAIDVDAPVSLAFRWLCQLKVSAYTYGRQGRSPRTLTPGVERLAVGQRFLAFDLVEFAEDDHLTGVTYPAARRKYGLIAITYRVVPRGEGASRYLVRLNSATRKGVGRPLGEALAFGDGLMMRKQLQTLKALAERDAAGARTQEGEG
ncbi:hypothetical protein AAHZ94_35545 [Streptomyces sp. HSW2009]|uniref:hypothetical protein n=1 Tax=Streptomyces sp. HSW2009 TaxID=3142890 RepID=UPI0032EEEDFE